MIMSCKYCSVFGSSMETGPAELYGKGVKNIRVGLIDRKLSIERVIKYKRSFTIEYLASFDVNYCPMCGRKLMEDDNVEDYTDGGRNG